MSIPLTTVESSMTLCQPLELRCDRVLQDVRFTKLSDFTVIVSAFWALVVCLPLTSSCDRLLLQCRVAVILCCRALCRSPPAASRPQSSHLQAHRDVNRSRVLCACFSVL